MNLDLTGKKALVTGSSRGLGQGMAEALMEAGAETVIMSRSPAIYERADAYRVQGYLCHAIQTDLSTKEGVEQTYHKSKDVLQTSPDILVNAAGIQRRHLASEFPYRDWREVLFVNLDAVFLLCQMAGREMIQKRHGKIINVASMMSFFGGVRIPAYAASKGGVTQLTKALANEWTELGICVNAVAPGYMDTDMNEALIQDPVRNNEILSRIPAGRWGKPEDMKGITVFLASEASDYISGAIIPIDGAYLAR